MRGKWVVNKLAVSESTLPRVQAAVALKCMQDSVRGTSFGGETGDGSAKTYVVKWTWPVPFPANAAELTSAMFASKPKGGTGCDGHGAPPKCFTCIDEDTCARVCVGYTEQCSFASIEQARACFSNGTTCTSGGAFGLSGGGAIIY